MDDLPEHFYDHHMNDLNQFKCSHCHEEIPKNHQPSNIWSTYFAPHSFAWTVFGRIQLKKFGVNYNILTHITLFNSEFFRTLLGIHSGHLVVEVHVEHSR